MYATINCTALTAEDGAVLAVLCGNLKENNLSGFVLPPIKHYLLGNSSVSVLWNDQSQYYGLETRASFQMPGAPNFAICQNTLEGGRKYWSGEVGRTYFTTVNFCHLPPASSSNLFYISVLVTGQHDGLGLPENFIFAKPQPTSGLVAELQEDESLAVPLKLVTPRYI